MHETVSSFVSRLFFSLFIHFSPLSREKEKREEFSSLGKNPIVGEGVAVESIELASSVMCRSRKRRQKHGKSGKMCEKKYYSLFSFELLLPPSLAFSTDFFFLFYFVCSLPRTEKKNSRDFPHTERKSVEEEKLWKSFSRSRSLSLSSQRALRVFWSLALHWACEIGETWHWWRLAPVRDRERERASERRAQSTTRAEESLWKNGCSCPFIDSKFSFSPIFLFFSLFATLFFSLRSPATQLQNSSAALPAMKTSHTRKKSSTHLWIYRRRWVKHTDPGPSCRPSCQN